jgi:chemotaxis protein methyltransferase WspC
MKVAKCGSAQEFWEYLNRKPAAVQALIEEVVVAETWFFREPAGFAVLQDVVVAQWLRTRQERPIRVLSMPCATGEEPYSIAISLLEVLGDPARFTVDAVDISERAVAKAVKAEYSARAFRGQDLAHRRRYFEESADGYQVIGAVRDCINFRTGNLLAPDLKTSGPYDCIFCRNVLIYLDRALKNVVTGHFSRMLASEGVLVVSAAEGAWLANSGFEALPNQPSAFRKRRAKVTILQPRNEPKQTGESASHNPIADSHALDIARAEADAGNLREAIQRCQDYLQRQNTSADGHYLLGQLQDAVNDDRAAIACYRRALYLDPHHKAALKQLARLHEKRGEFRESRQWSTRLERLVRSA